VIPTSNQDDRQGMKFKKTKQRHLKKIAELKQENRELKQQAVEVKKNTILI
jgi:hypothetical protein